MFPPEKIEEWMQEVEARPTSASLIIQFIANRLNELSKWNEELRQENIALRTDKRVREYEQQINHLEYQLDLLKRQFQGELPDVETLVVASQPAETFNLLVYDAEARILRLPLNITSLEDGLSLGKLSGLALKGELPRLLVVPSSEELLCVFTSGRIAPLPVDTLPLTKPADDPISWDQVQIPHEPGVGDVLTCLMPASKMALADFFIQFSRRGFMKKIRMALAASIMENLYIGTGTKLPADQTLDLALGHAQDQYALISREGYLQSVTADMLSYAVEEAVRLNSSDHLVAAFPFEPDQSIIVMTQVGKTIHRTADSIEVAEALKRKGRALYSKARREKGVRVIGAAAVCPSDWSVALQQDGSLSLRSMQALFESGTVPVNGELLAFVAFTPPQEDSA